MPCMRLEARVALAHLIVGEECFDIHRLEGDEIVLAVIAGVGGDE